MRQLALGVFLVFSLCSDDVLSAAEPLRTAAETSDYQATSSYAEVVAFCGELRKQSGRVRQLTLGKSQEGRQLPLLIIANPPVATAAEAVSSNKLVVLAIANIHAGEVDGKEVLLMLARDLALAEEHSLLDRLVIALVPIFNADGNERLGNHRPEQAGPREVGTRENASGLDLNRDFLKLETPEVRSLVRFLNTWNPAIVIDCHTTNGSHHRYTLTYEGGRCPAGDPRLAAFTRDKLLPLAGRKLAERTGFQSYFYGNFAADHTQWETILPLPRYGTHYVGLRNRVAVLSESYSYAPFKDRVLATQEFVRGVLQVASENHDELRKLMPQSTEPKAAARASRVALRYKAAPHGPKAKVLGYVEAQQGGRRVATSEPRDYEAQYFGGTETTLAIELPDAYLLPARLVKVVENLQRHGLTAEQLAEDSELDVEVYRVDELNRARSFQRHELVGLEVTPRKEKRRIETGTILIRTAQPLGSLAVHLLEPQSADGLATWNFFDEWLAVGSDYPVLRLPSAATIHSARLRPPPEDSR
jgi:dipeptidyl-peptidase 4